MRGWQVAAGAGTVTAVAVTAFLVTTITIGGEPPDGGHTPPADGSEQPVSTEKPSPTPTVDPTAPATNSEAIVVGVASIVVVAALLIGLRMAGTSRRTISDDHVPRMGEPQEFARRIVDDL